MGQAARRPSRDRVCGHLSLTFDKFDRHRSARCWRRGTHRQGRIFRGKTDMEAMDAVGNAAAHTDFSPLGLFLMADIVVKFVMLGLLAASIWCWAIIIDKSMMFTRVRRDMNQFEKTFWSGQSLEELYQTLSQRPASGLAAIFVAAMKEWKRSHEQNAASYIGVQARLDKVLDVAIARESEELEKRLSFLATVGSAAPFIGLFGTVWGIMNAFSSIASAQSASLGVVAGPIAEALFATAIGLVAAIPAVIAYKDRKSTRLNSSHVRISYAVFCLKKKK